RKCYLQPMPLALNERPRCFDSGRYDCLHGNALLVQLQPSPRNARDIQQVIEKKRHTLHLPGDDVVPPAAPALVRSGQIQELHGIENGGERIAQLMSEDGEKFVLAPVRLAQRLLRLLQPADVEVDSRPAGNSS